MIKTDREIPQDSFRLAQECLKAVDSVPGGGFSEFTGFDAFEDGAAVEQDSRQWLGRFLRSEANPYESDLLVYRYAHPSTPQTYDFLWHAYNVGYAFDEVEDFLQVVVIESAEYVLIRTTPVNLPILRGTEGETARFIATAASYLLPLTGTIMDAFGQDIGYQWTFQYASPLAEGAWFTTNPDADPFMLESWAERVDGGIHQGQLFFIGYKSRTSGDGSVISLAGRKWFDGSCWAPYEAMGR